MAEQATAPAHQFDTSIQQYEASTLGMWVFLLTEIMFFGGMFLGYTVYRLAYPEAFAEGSHHLDVVLGGINTAVLIGSSLTMALAVHAAQVGERRQLIRCLTGTLGFEPPVERIDLAGADEAAGLLERTQVGE